MIERLLLKPEEGFEQIGVGRAKGYQMLMNGELPSIRIGRLRRIPLDALRRWIEERTEAALAEREKDR
jgi:excisionase family DNA binding protein